MNKAGRFFGSCCSVFLLGETQNRANLNNKIWRLGVVNVAGDDANDTNHVHYVVLCQITSFSNFTKKFFSFHFLVLV